MSLSAAEVKAKYPLPAYNFQVVLEGSAAPIRFARVGGLAREASTLTYRDGLSFLEGERIVKYFIDKYTSLTLDQGTVSGDTLLLEWLETKAPRAMEVSLCDEQGTPLVSWRFAKALPTKLTGATLDASTNDVAVDQLEVKVAGLTIVHNS